MNYWSISPGDLESLVLRRSGATGFEGIPAAGFPFEVPSHSVTQNQQQNSASSNSNNDHCAMQQQARGQQQQQQHQQAANRNVTATPPNPSYIHPQQSQQQAQQQQHQQQQLRQAKVEARDAPQQPQFGGPLSLQIAHMQPLNNEVFLFPTANPQATVANPVVASVAAGMLLSALPSAVTTANNQTASAPNASMVSTPAASAAQATAPAPAAAKPKKKKAKKSAATIPASLTMPSIPRAPAPRAQCLLCERNYGNRRDLRRHVLAHHEGVRYMCRLCSKVMMSAKSVRAHLKSSAHRLLNDDEIALNIEKMTPGAATQQSQMVPLASFNAAGATSSSTSGSTSTATVAKKEM